LNVNEISIGWEAGIPSQRFADLQQSEGNRRNPLAQTHLAVSPKSIPSIRSAVLLSKTDTMTDTTSAGRPEKEAKTPRRFTRKHSIAMVKRPGTTSIWTVGAACGHVGEISRTTVELQFACR
jgi:hypothetical protein